MAGIHLTIDDVRQMALELWLAQREAAQLRQENDRLRAELAQPQEGAGRPEGD